MKIKYAVTMMSVVGIVSYLGMTDVLGAEEDAVQSNTQIETDAPQQEAVSPDTVTPDEGLPGDQHSPIAVATDAEPPALADAIRRALNPVGEIIGNPDEKVLYAEGDVVSLRIESSIDAKPHQMFALVRPAQRVKHPKTRRALGRLTKVVGTVQLEEAFGKFWSGRIVRASDFVSLGDVVVASEAAAEGDPSDRSLTPDHGYVVAVPDDVVLTAAFQTVYTDLGRNDAVEPGHVLSIIRDGKSGRRGGPPRKIGEARVLRVEPASSAVFITRSTEPIQIGDRLEPLSGASLR